MEGIDPDTLLEWLQTGAGEERDLQLMALEQLCMLLLMSDNIDRCFESCPPRTFIPALCKVFLDETATENVLEVTARAITYYLDVSNECTRRITQVEGAVRAICHRLSVADMSDRTSKDLAEQCVKLLEHVCQRETPAVYEAGGLHAMLTMVGQNGSLVHKDTLYSAMTVVQRLCSRVEPSDQNLDACAADLGRLLTHDDQKVAESALRCFAALTDRFIRKSVDPAGLAEPSNLVQHLLNSLMPLNAHNDGMSTARSSSFISIVLSLLSNLCRGSHKVTAQVISSDELVPALRNILASKDERCVLDTSRLVDLLMVLMCEGRSALPKANSALSADGQPGGSNYDRSHRYLIDAIRQRDTDALIDAFENGNVDPNFTDDAGQTLLNWCAAFGTLDMVQYLCDKGADVNKGQRSSSLHYAACFGRVDIVIALLRNGANPELRDEEGRTALDKARERADESHQQVINILESPSSYMTAAAERVVEAAQSRAVTEEPEVAQIEPVLVKNVIQQLIPVLCSVFSNSLVNSVRRATLSIVVKCVQHCSVEALDELREGKVKGIGATDDNTAAFFVDNLMKVIVTVLNEEDNVEGHEQVLKILLSLFEKQPNFWVDELVRLGVVEKVEHLALTGFVSEGEPEPKRRRRSISRTPSVGLRSAAESPCSRTDSAQAERHQMLNIPVQSEEDALHTKTPSPTPEHLVESSQQSDQSRSSAEPNSSTSAASLDCWVLQDKSLYKWRDWRLMRSTDSLYIWCDAVALELSDGSNGWLRFYLDGRLSTMYSSGVPESGPDNTETRSDFIRKFQANRNATGSSGMAPRPVFSNPLPGKTITSGNWQLGCNEADELTVANKEGGQQKIVIKEDLPGFQYEASKFTTKSFMAESTLGAAFVTGWAARGGDRRLQFRTEAQKQKIHDLAKELWDKYLSEAHNKPRPVFVELRNAATDLVQAARLCAQDQEDLSNAAHVFENDAVLSSMVHRVVEVLESVEKFNQYLYDAPGGSAFGLQLLTRRLRFSMEQAKPGAPGQTDLLDRTNRVMKTEPLTTVGQVRTFLHRMVAKMWYDFPRESMEFVRILSERHAANQATTFSYESDFDTNGLVWFLGTNGRTETEWLNPAAVNVVHVTSVDSAKLPYGCHEDILSRDVNPLNCHTSDHKSAHFTIDLGVFIRPSAYTVRHARGYGRSAMRTWDFEGSVDGVKWILLSRHFNDKSLNDAGATATFVVPSTDETPRVRYVRIQQKGVNASGVTHYLSLSGFEVYGEVLGVVRENLDHPAPVKKSTKKLRSLPFKMDSKERAVNNENVPITFPNRRVKGKVTPSFGRTHRVNSSDSNSSIPGIVHVAQSSALNPATVATALAHSSATGGAQLSPNSSIQQKSMSTTNLLDAHVPPKSGPSVSATQQASSAESLQHQSPSLENLLSRARVHTGERRIPDPVPEHDALDEYSSRGTHQAGIVSQTEESKNLSVSSPDLVQPSQQALHDPADAHAPEGRPERNNESADEENVELYNNIVDMYQDFIRGGHSIEDASEVERVVLNNCYAPGILNEIIEADDISNFEFDNEADEAGEFGDSHPSQTDDSDNQNTDAGTTSRRTLTNLGQGIKSRLGNYAGAIKNIVSQAVDPSSENTSRSRENTGLSNQLEEFFEELFADDDDCEDDYGTSLPGAEGATLERLATVAPPGAEDRLRRQATESSTVSSESAGPSSAAPAPHTPSRLNWRNILRGSGAATAAPSASRFTAIPLRSELVRILAESTMGQAPAAHDTYNNDFLMTMLDAAGLRSGSAAQHRSNTGGRNTRKPTRNWDDEYVLRRQFHALIPAFDPRPGRNNVNQTSDLELPPRDVKLPKRNARRRKSYIPANSDDDAKQATHTLQVFLRGPNLNGVENATVALSDDDETMFAAVQRLLNLTKYNMKSERGRKIWEPSYTIIYQNAQEEGETPFVEVAPESNADDLINPGNKTVKQCLDTLQAFHELAGDKASTDSFVSQKMTQKLSQALSDPLVVSANALPSWCETLVFHYPCLFTMETRSMFMNATAFGTSRAIVWLQNKRDHMLEEARNSVSGTATNTAGVRREDHYPEFRIGRIKHERIKVHRSDQQLFDNAVRVMKFHAPRKAILEVEYIGEEGTGLGPTLEFYALVAAEFQRKSLAMWLCDDADEAQLKLEKKSLDLGEGKKPPGYYVRRAGGLFPAPAPQNSQEAERIADLFRILGIFLAKVLQDGRLVDMPLALPFLKLVISEAVAGQDDYDLDAVCLDGLLNLSDLELIHPHKARFLRAVQKLCIEKAAIRLDKSLDATQKLKRISGLKLRFNNDGSAGHECRVEDLALTFVVNPPSEVFKYDEYELIPGGNNVDVTIDNIELYLGKCVDFYLNSGIRKQVMAFREGFDYVFPLRSLKSFSALEVQKLISGEQCPEWCRDDLLNYTEPKLGYTRDSPGFLRFVDVVAEMSAEERKAFLQFTTGCSSLPPGGLANLHPRLTVVRKVDGGGDGSYPSVNTCVHYLKLPDYSSAHILRERLLAATMEKGFHLN